MKLVPLGLMRCLLEREAEYSKGQGPGNVVSEALLHTGSV